MHELSTTEIYMICIDALSLFNVGVVIRTVCWDENSYSSSLSFLVCISGVFDITALCADQSRTLGNLRK